MIQSKVSANRTKKIRKFKDSSVIAPLVTSLHTQAATTQEHRSPTTNNISGGTKSASVVYRRFRDGISPRPTATAPGRPSSVMGFIMAALLRLKCCCLCRDDKRPNRA